MTTLRRLAAFLILCCPSSAFAFDKPTAWSAASSPTFPVVPVFSCPNHFASAFPGFSWNNIRGHALAAANEWFVDGNADVRLRIQTADLAASDPRCATGSGAAGTGQILLTAETNFGVAGVCRFASTFGGPGTSSATVIMHRGCVNASGAYSDLNWATNAEFPAASQADFWAVLLHEFGHALGFNHDTDPKAVMFPSIQGLGDDSQRNLSRNEIVGLKDPASPYGAIQTTSLHRRADASGAGVASTWQDEGEPTNVAMVGAPSIYRATRFNTSSFYLAAFVRASDSAVMWGRTDGANNWTAGFAPVSATSRHPPAVAGDAASPQEVLAYVNDTLDGEIVFRTTSTGTSWNAPTILTNQVSRVGPAIAYLANRNVYVMAWPDSRTGRIRTAISLDNGTTFINVQEWAAARTYHRIGITCPGFDQCLLGFSDGSKVYTQWSYLNLTFISGWPFIPLSGFGAGSGGSLGQDSYGGGLGTSPTQVQFGWRDRGTSTVMTSDRRGIGSNVNTLVFIPSVTHSALSVSFDAGAAGVPRFSLWSTFASRYDK